MHKLFSLTSAKFKRAICLFLVMANIFCSYGVLLAEEIGDETDMTSAGSVETTLGEVNDNSDVEETSQETSETTGTAVQPSVTPVPTPTAIPSVSASDEDNTASDKRVLNSYGAGYTVTVSYGPETGIPADAELVVNEIPAGDVYDEYMDKASEALGRDELGYARLFDISLVKDGVEIEPANGTSVAVRIVLTDAKDRNLNVVHMPEGADAEVVDASCHNSGMGAELAFDADGFSAYAIVEGPSSQSSQTGEYVQTVAELDGKQLIPEIKRSNGEKNYLLNSLVSKDGHYEIKSVKVSATAAVPDTAAKYLFEKVEGSSNLFYISTIVDGNKKYVADNADNNGFLFVDDVSNASQYPVSLYGSTNGEFKISSPVNSDTWTVRGGSQQIQYSVADSYRSKFRFISEASHTDDPYDLNGKTYGLMFYNSGTAGKALMSDSEVSGTGRLDAMAMTVMTKKTDHGDKLFVSSDSDASMWTFTWASGEDYYLTTTVDGQTKYLSVTASGLTIVDTPATVSITAGSGENAGKIKITGNGSAVYYSGDVGTGFASTGLVKNSWLNLVEMSELTKEYFLTFSANKVSASDYDNVTDGSKVIIYTRVWDETAKRYKFYAVDHDGTLVPCFEDGDTIEWIDNGINTLLWDVIEYYDDQGNPNRYYDLYNEYSGKYIAPQEGQILSDEPLGVNLPGRKKVKGHYYTPIIAWDDDNYSYVGLKSSGGAVVSCPKDEAEDYYFAIMRDVFIDETLHEVPTVNNDIFGITMKMKNFRTRKEMSDFLGNDQGGVGTVLHQGLLSTNLDPNTGYPTTTIGNKNLGSLFSGSEKVNHLFIDSIHRGSGYFEYDSTQNYAALVGEDGSYFPGEGGAKDFRVYQELGTYDTYNNATRKHGLFFPYDYIKPGVYTVVNGENLYNAKAQELSENDPRKYERLHLIGGGSKTEPDCYFGMEMSTSFVQTPSGRDSWGHDIIYEFTGDDDFWLYVDGELVLDLGGIHSAVEGTINYCTGDVTVNGVNTTLREVFKSNYQTRYPDKTPAEIDAMLEEIFEKNERGQYTFKDYTFHEMKIFYMERGAGGSNLHMRFNQSSVKPGTVVLGKEIDVGEGDNAELLLSGKFPFKIEYFQNTDDPARFPDGYNPNSPITLTPDSGYKVYYQGTTEEVEFRPEYTIDGVTYNNVYMVNAGEMIEMTLPDDAIHYRLTECAVNHLIYDKVYVNDEEVEPIVHSQANRYDYIIPIEAIKERTSIKFDNHVDPEAVRNLTIQKVLYDENGTTPVLDDDTPFNFRLYLAGESDEELVPADMFVYHVKDREGYYCRWDAGTQSFVSIGKKNHENLTDAEKAQIRFTTSMYGSISKIPAFYTVEIRGLLVGTRYKVEERDYEIPDGYSLDRYTLNIDQHDPAVVETTVPVEETIITGEDPNVQVNNLKGYGVRIYKNWTDADYMEMHGDVYFALFHGTDPDNLSLITALPDNEGVMQPVNTVKKLENGETTLYWYMEHLLNDDKNIKNYYAREVIVDGSGNVTGYLKDGDIINVDAKIIGSEDAPVSYPYAVTYAERTEECTSTVQVYDATNDRPGIAIYKQDMESNYLAGAKFTLTDSTGRILGNYTSGDDGFITKAYLRRNENYYLREIVSPVSHRAMIRSATLMVDNDGILHVNGDDTEYADYYDYTHKNTGDDILVIKNKPYTFKVMKMDYSGENALEGAHFELHRQITAGGITTIDLDPMPGFGDLVTGRDGVLPKIDSTLPAGVYELWETAAPIGFKKMEFKVLFSLSEDGEIELLRTERYGDAVKLTKTDNTEKTETDIILSIANTPAEGGLVVTKTVEGNFGSRTKEFSFRINLKNSAGTNLTGTIPVSKNGGAPVNTTLSSGNINFTLSDSDYVTFMLPENTKFIVTETNPEGYTVERRIGTNEFASGTSISGTYSTDKRVDFKNTKNGVIPTGLKTSFNLSVSILCAMTAGLVVRIVYCRRRRRRYGSGSEFFEQ